MYIDLDLNDPVFEVAELNHIQNLIGSRYTLLSTSKMKVEIV